MKIKEPGVIRCMTEYDNEVNQWVALSLEFCLATQADTEQEAKQKLIAQIMDYIEEANGIHQTHKAQLLNRKAPFNWYILYYCLVLKGLCKKRTNPHLFYQSTH